ncbi:hypothetical protein [Sphingobium amiense]|nr:hypothetical protein [Sphingobium amiense]
MDGEPDQNEKSMAPTQLAMIAELLAAVGSMLAARAARRRGGPGAMRRARAIAIALLSLVVALSQDGDIAAMRRGWATTARRLRRHMAQPPAGWTAP